MTKSNTQWVVSSTYDILKDGVIAAISPNYSVNTNGIVVTPDTDPETFVLELRKLKSGLIACPRTFAPRIASLHSNHPMAVCLNTAVEEIVRSLFGNDIPSTDFTHEAQTKNFSEFKKLTSRQLVYVLHFRVESD